MVSGNQPAESDNNAHVEGSIETSHLLEQVPDAIKPTTPQHLIVSQIEALRGTVRFLQTEYSYLKGQDLLKEIQALPPLPEPVCPPPTPPLDSSTHSATDDPLSRHREDALPRRHQGLLIAPRCQRSTCETRRGRG